MTTTLVYENGKLISLHNDYTDEELEARFQCSLDAPDGDE